MGQQNTCTCKLQDLKWGVFDNSIHTPQSRSKSRLLIQEERTELLTVSKEIIAPMTYSCH